jgi:YVTN family beta-propeller protein
MLLRFVLVLALAAGCSSAARGPMVSSTIALTSDDRALWVVNPDADSVSVVDTASRAAVEVALAPAPVVAADGRFTPAVKPRALAILPGDAKIYVAGQSANRVFVVDAKARRVLTSIAVAAAPVGVVAAPDGSAVYAVSHEAAVVTRIDPRKDVAVATLAVPEHPWGASISDDGRRLYVSHLLVGAGVTTIDLAAFAVQATVALAEQPPVAGVKTRPQGVARGVYVAVPRPHDGELWAPHLLLAIHTPEPALDFQSTVFPTVSTLDPSGAREARRLLFRPLDNFPDGSGSFTDVVSGPRALAFTPDGRLALMADGQSEDVMVLDASDGVEVGLVRPLPAAFLEGIAVDHAGRRAYVHGRNSENVVVLAIASTTARGPAGVASPVAVDGEPIALVAADPMPPALRLGQRLFYSANSSAFPLTRNFWVACSTCHLEGATDAVTWQFLVGPRDTPSNGGGPINTGFLLRQALRNQIVDYDTTIRLEQGGSIHRGDPALAGDLDALAAFVNYAIPFPQNPNRASDRTLTAAQRHGRDLFQQRCSSCHTGDYLTDSGSGNPTLDLAGPIVLHDIGTCVTTGAFADRPAVDDVIGKMHSACNFDTPTLRGVFATAPYFHDGSAATLRDVVDRLPFSSSLSDEDKNDLVAYVKTL